MRCDAILIRDPVFVSPSDTVQRAALIMLESNVGFLPVCDAERHVIGVLTDRDLVTRILAEGRSQETPVRDVMTAEDIVTCRPDDEIEEPGRLMREHGIGRIVVSDEENTLAGVVSLADIVRYENESDSAEVWRDVTEREVEEPLS
jgi:CBS domain-containing protein